MAGSRSDYFAFGSNLQLAQMAQRCPSSLFKGKATLPGWKWQINQRGVANIVESHTDHVEGLVFSINALDMRTLDRSEGIRRGLYERRFLSINLDEISDGPWKTGYVARQLQGRHYPSIRTNTKHIKALVYVSSRWALAGKIRLEYIERMDRAMADATALGVSMQYIRRYVMPFLDGPVMLPDEPDPAQQQELLEQRVLVRGADLRRLPLQESSQCAYWPSVGQAAMAENFAPNRQFIPEGTMSNMRPRNVFRNPVYGMIGEHEGHNWSTHRVLPWSSVDYATTEPSAAMVDPSGYSSDAAVPVRARSRRHKRSHSADEWPAGLVRDKRGELCSMRKGRSIRYYYYR